MAGTLKYAVVIERGANNYSAYVPDLPGCVAAGDTEAEVKVLIAEAVQIHLRAMREDGDPIPEPTSLSYSVEIAA